MQDPLSVRALVEQIVRLEAENRSLRTQFQGWSRARQALGRAVGEIVAKDSLLRDKVRSLVARYRRCP